ERTRKRLHTVTCYHPCLTQEWRDTDWFKTAFPTNSKTASLHPECKQIFAVHAPSAYTHNSTPFSCQWVGPPGPWKLITQRSMVQDNRGKISSHGAVQERYKFVGFLRIPMASLQGSAVRPLPCN